MPEGYIQGWQLRLAQPWVTVRLWQAHGIASIAGAGGDTHRHTPGHTLVQGALPVKVLCLEGTCLQYARRCKQVALRVTLTEWEPCIAEAALQVLNI